MMATKSERLPGWGARRVFFPAGDYQHPPAGLLQLRLVRRGSSYADIDLGAGVKRVFTRPGDLLLSLPDQPTVFRIEQGRELTMINISREHAVALAGEAGGGIAELAILLERPMRDALLAELCRRLEDTAAAETAYWEASLLVVMATLLRHARSRRNAAKPTVLSHRRLRAVLDLIEARLESSFTVAELAAAAGISGRAFSAAFREAMALPVHQYVLQRRAERAFELLTATQLPLAQIARRAGFAHQAHMTRVVSRLKGATPGRIRRNIILS